MSVVIAWIGSAIVGGAASLNLVPSAYAEEKPGASADGVPSDIDRARVLAKQAKRALEKAQHYAEALDYATQAEALYHAPVHLGIISEALIGMGRGAEAIAVLERLVSEPLPANAPEAFRTAQEDGRRRLKDLSARVPSLLLVVHGPPANAVNATVDDKPFALTGDTATRLDPGVHRIRAAAPGFLPFEQTVTLPAKGGVVIVQASFKVEGVSATSGDTPPVTDTQKQPERSPSRIPWITAFSVGAAGLVVGGISGGVYLSKLNALKARCPANQCASTDHGEAQSIGTIGDVSTVSLVVGGIGVATGGVLLLTQRSGRSSPQEKHGQSAFSGGDRGIVVELTFGGVGARGWF